MASCLSELSPDNLVTTPTADILDIPSSVIAYTICPYLSSHDLLSWRSTCSFMLSIISGDDQSHQTEEHNTSSAVSSTTADGTITYSNDIWKVALKRDFKLDTELYGYQTLRLKPLKQPKKEDEGETVSVLGYKAQDSIMMASSAFDSWKYWKKASYIFYDSDRSTETYFSLHLHAPYYIRAAKLWSKIENWMECSKCSQDVGRRIKHTLQKGISHRKFWNINMNSAVHISSGSQAIEAIYAFYGGQDIIPPALSGHDEEGFLNYMFSGLLGGYEAYNMHSCTYFILPQLILTCKNYTDSEAELDVVEECEKIRIASCSHHQSPVQPDYKNFFVDCISGAVFVDCGPQLRMHTEHSYPIVDRGLDSALLWFEEYATRLQEGTIGVAPIRPLSMQSNGRPRAIPYTIVLYPQFTAQSNRRGSTGMIPMASRAVTKGVEVVASAVFTPNLVLTNGIGFVYSIRIRLLSCTEEGYMSPTERGFDHCQLVSRHWRIRNDTTGEVDRVDGGGVIGMYPILVDGGYWEDGQRFHGTFMYQSCSNSMKLGSFQGHLMFVPVTLSSSNINGGSESARDGTLFTRQPQSISSIPPLVEQHQDRAFDVEVAPFILDSEPKFLY